MIKIRYFIALLFFFVVGSYIALALGKLIEYRQKVDAKVPITMETLTLFVYSELLKEWIYWTAPSPLSPNDSTLRSFYITLKPSDINTLNAALPTIDKEHTIKGYFKASDDTKPREVKVRYRGDSHLHWFYPQKSLKIKLSKNDSYQMQQTLNLINPPHDFSIIDTVSNHISKNEGLLTPEYEPIRLYINNLFMGVYVLLTQIDESFLRKNHKMPGSIYFGDMQEEDLIDLGTPAELFYSTRYWEKEAARNADYKTDRSDIEFFIDAINTQDPLKFYEFAQTSLNLEQYFTFIGLDTLFGAFHHDYAHNHKLYVDPYKGMFEPIQWDLRYWSASSAKDLSLYPLLHAIATNPILEAKRDARAYALLKKYPSKTIIAMLQKEQLRITPDLKTDTHRDTGIHAPSFGKGIATPFTMHDFETSITQYSTTIKNREASLYAIYNNARVFYDIRKGQNGEELVIITVDGNSPVKIIFDEKTIYQDTNLNLALDKEDRILTSKEVILYPARSFIPSNPLNAPSALYGTKQLQPSPCDYSFIASPSVLETMKVFNDITKEPITPKRHTWTPAPLHDSIHPWRLPVLSPEHLTLQGDITIENDQSYGANTTVTILPGTRLKLSPNASLFFYGKVLMQGTQEQPIVFERNDPLFAWGSVVIQGQSASSSHIAYTHFKGGSLTKKGLIQYTAMLNLHDLKDFTLTHSIIEDNTIGDDAMHVAYANGIVEYSLFKNAFSDALDIDIAQVTISHNTFDTTGNDALDIMTTTLHANDNIFLNTGDKGISVGEASKAYLQNNYFKNNVIGIEVKDGSTLSADTITIEDAKQKAINAYHKNKRYDKGGEVSIKNLILKGNTTLSHDKHSTITLEPSP